MAATVIVDREGSVVAWNAEATALLGYPSRHAIGRSMEFFIPEDYRPMHWTGFRGAMVSEKLKFGPSDVLPVEMIHQNGARLPVDVHVVAQRDDDGRIMTLTATLKRAVGR
jgi:PAS domain S-box-containing protein